MRTWCLVLASLPLLACSSSSSAPASVANVDAGSVGNDASAQVGTIVEHGTIVDYFTLKPVAGLAVADNGVMTTTDADGKWSLSVPANSVLQPMVTGPKYTKLLFPDSAPSGAEADFGTSVMPDSSTYNLEQNSLDNFDPNKALVQIVLVPTGACTSLVGGKAKVVSPAGAALTYFGGSSGIPLASVDSFEAVKPDRPVVVAYNIDVGAELVVEITHPTCKQVAYPVTYAGKTYSGKVRTQAAEPGDLNSALVIVMQ